MPTIHQNYCVGGTNNAQYIKTSKLLREALDKKYKLKDAAIKKFLVGNYLDYKMIIATKLIVNQMEKLQIIIFIYKDCYQSL